jgi:hypothetical protein
VVGGVALPFTGAVSVVVQKPPYLIGADQLKLHLRLLRHQCPDQAKVTGSRFQHQVSDIFQPLQKCLLFQAGGEMGWFHGLNQQRRFWSLACALGVVVGKGAGEASEPDSPSL